MKKWILCSLLVLSNETLASQNTNHMKISNAIKQSFGFSKIDKCQDLKCWATYSVLTVHNGAPKKILLTPSALMHSSLINTISIHFNHDQATIDEQKS